MMPNSSCSASRVGMDPSTPCPGNLHKELTLLCARMWTTQNSYSGSSKKKSFSSTCVQRAHALLLIPCEPPLLRTVTHPIHRAPGFLPITPLPSSGSTTASEPMPITAHNIICLGWDLFRILHHLSSWLPRHIHPVYPYSSFRNKLLQWCIIT